MEEAVAAFAAAYAKQIVRDHDAMGKAAKVRRIQVAKGA
jgi:hypothetical protein